MMRKESKETVFLNGEFFPAEKARVSVFTSGFTCGLGVFESMRAYRNKIVYLVEHLKRLKQSARALKLSLPYTQKKLTILINEILRRNQLPDAYLRLTLWQAEGKPEIALWAKAYRPYPVDKYKKGFSAWVSTLRQQDVILARFKTTSRLLYESSFNTAKDKGFDEALILNFRGYLAEASRANIFFVKNNALFTPDFSCGCLEGVTRRFVFDFARKTGFKIYPGNFTLNDLFQAEEAFLTNSLIGIMPLSRVNRKNIGGGKNALTSLISKNYNRVLYGKK